MKNLCRQQGQGLKACGTTLPKLSLSAPKGGGGGGYFLIIGSGGCAAGWGRIFTTALTIIGSHFQ